MSPPTEATITDLPELRDRLHVFADRAEAGAVLAGMLRDYRESDALVLAIPAGGLPVAAALATKLSLLLDVAVVSKITLPWNTEAGYGAVAFDGTVMLNRPMIAEVGLSEQEVEQGIAATTQKVERRLRALRGSRPLPEMTGQAAIVVDDGLASGFTMRAAVAAARKAGAASVVVAVPTAHLDAARRLAQETDAVYVANLRGGWRFAVAEAYEDWHDVTEEEAARLLAAVPPLRDGEGARG